MIGSTDVELDIAVEGAVFPQDGMVMAGRVNQYDHLLLEQRPAYESDGPPKTFHPGECATLHVSQSGFNVCRHWRNAMPPIVIGNHVRPLLVDKVHKSVSAASGSFSVLPDDRCAQFCTGIATVAAGRRVVGQARADLSGPARSGPAGCCGLATVGAGGDAAGASGASMAATTTSLRTAP